MKVLSVENWLQVDPTTNLFKKLEGGRAVDISGEQRLKFINSVSLNEAVPMEVRELCYVAKGALVYGYFYYPLYTLAVEQMFRVAEAAARHKCYLLGIRKEKMMFGECLRNLNDAGIKIDTEKWDFLRKFRNKTSHLEDRMVLMPDDATILFHVIMKDINRLFECSEVVKDGVSHA